MVVVGMRRVANHAALVRRVDPRDEALRAVASVASSLASPPPPPSSSPALLPRSSHPTLHHAPPDLGDARRRRAWAELADSLDAVAAERAARARAATDSLIGTLFEGLRDASRTAQTEVYPHTPAPVLAPALNPAAAPPAPPRPPFTLGPAPPSPPPPQPNRESAVDRQLRLEESAVDDAVERHNAYINAALARGDVGELRPIQRILLSWFTPVTDKLAALHASLRGAAHPTAAASFLLMLDPKPLAVIAIHETLAMCLARDDRSLRMQRVAARLGAAVKAETNLRALTALRKERAKEKANAVGVAVETESRRRLAGRTDAKRKGRNRALESIVTAVRPRLHTVNFAAVREEVARKEWDTETEVQVGGYLIQVLLDACAVDIDNCGRLVVDTHGDVEPTQMPAFRHVYDTELQSRLTGQIVLHPAVAQVIMSSADELRESILPRYRPMVVSPRPWTSIDRGGYLQSRVSIMRRRPNDDHQRELRLADMRPVYQGLNVLGSQPWRVNKPILDVASTLWERGGGAAGLVSRFDEEIPEVPSIKFTKPPEASPEERADMDSFLKLRREARRATKVNRERHSLRCDTNYRLKQAAEFATEDRIYLPHSLDFRGRAYPIPAHLQHMGSDMCRGMLTFAKPGRPLGERGVFWLKIHLANLLGHDKLPFEERVRAAEDILPTALNTARDPYSDANHEFWTSQEDPFQVLAACFEFQHATKHARRGVPLDRAMESFESTLPVQMDGSCNGLQHYAALGRDVEGGIQVNLVPSDRPMDVYSGVAAGVAKAVARDAALGDEHAKLLNGRITRKIVKQTVMTSVYGVTHVGAREQIQNRLRELAGLPEDQTWWCAYYLSKLTLASLGDLFTGATNTMEWLARCAQSIAKVDDAVQWVTPLGLPIMQPYRQQNRKLVRTVVQQVSLATDDEGPVARQRQRTAFPPNYIHSLDSSHMLMTAIASANAGINFASVHDSFWTNAADVDIMNRILRQQFVELHQRDLLEDLLAFFKARHEHKGVDFPDLPERGSLNLEGVLSSRYFFN